MSASDRFATLGLAFLCLAVYAIYLACNAPQHSIAVFLGGMASAFFVSACMLMIWLGWQSKVEARMPVVVARPSR